MTVRTQTIDMRTTWTSANGTTHNTGMYSRKIQDGVNSVVIKIYNPKTRRTTRKVRYSENPYSMSYYRNVQFPIRYRRRNNPDQTWLDGSPSATFSFPPSIPGTWTSNDTADLVGKLQSRVRGSTFDASVTLAEGKESLKTIANGAMRINGAINALMRGDLRKLAEHLGLPVDGKRRRPSKNLTKTWLEYKYGWMPILNDTYSAAQYLAYAVEKPRTQKYTVTKRKVFTPSVNNNVTFGSHSRFMIKRLTYIAKEPSYTASLSDLLNPSLVVWEKIPYSFVVDWFLPIGNYLQARSFLGTLQGTFEETTFDKLVCTRIYSGRDVEIESGPGEIADAVLISLTRSLTSTYSIDPPQFKPLRESLDWKKAMSAISLLNNLR